MRSTQTILKEIDFCAIDLYLNQNVQNSTKKKMTILGCYFKNIVEKSKEKNANSWS